MKFLRNSLIVFGLFILSQLGTTAFGIIKGFTLIGGQTSLSPMNIFITIIITVATIVITMQLAKKLGLCNFKWDWLTKRNIGFILLCYIAGRVVVIGGTFLGEILYGQKTTANDELIGKIFSGESPILLFMLIAVAAPIMEEIVFRGGIMGLMFKEHPFIGLAVSSIIFGLMHSATTLIEFMIYALLGFIMAYAYKKTERLEVAIAVHFVNNAIAAIALFNLF
ncbi:CPBP family intramembrane metalloprotease [Enterococcus sp. BWB1-3]|uniref:CPBP family intramembrane glutamic endopeptidase n=1 Tax=Enterococcus sp. BWB1-3 TaxID=2787713 RepID=UPI0019204459|nr:type II CAAX endopeptidase family protein [Enterococcus sp. BWB1-3]MBL1227750.1 CPBP family intramembrane metalloprotease [Enterococcus sp. BWB1-3]